MSLFSNFLVYDLICAVYYFVDTHFQGKLKLYFKKLLLFNRDVLILLILCYSVLFGHTDLQGTLKFYFK